MVYYVILQQLTSGGKLLCNTCVGNRTNWFKPQIAVGLVI